MLLALLISLVVFLAVFVQAFTGFGMAMVAMPALTALVGIHIAAPLVALVSLVARIGMIAHYRTHFELRGVWRLILASAFGIPLGLFFFHQLEVALVERLLGVIVVGYVLYTALSPRAPQLDSNRWAYGLGLASGVLTGAYNIGGPPVVIYANSQDWPAIVFKSNLQAFAMTSAVLVVLSRGLNGEINDAVLLSLLLSLPAILVGLVLGFQMDRWAKGTFFRTVVLVLLFMLGLTLIF
jgi:hypothetical protein